MLSTDKDVLKLDVPLDIFNGHLTRRCHWMTYYTQIINIAQTHIKRTYKYKYTGIYL